MDASLIRARARAALSGRWALAIAVGALAVLLGAAMNSSTFIPDFSYDAEWFRNYQQFFEQGVPLGENTTVRFENGLLGIVQLLLGGVLQLGYARFLLNLHDGKEVSLQDLFSEFHRFGQGFAQHFLRSLYVLLWSLLLIIPGIIKSLSYAMTPYIMADHPQLTASEAIRVSMDMMEGHKAALFWLRLSFIGWDILAALSLNLGHLFLNPYKNAAETAFYRSLEHSIHGL